MLKKLVEILVFSLGLFSFNYIEIRVVGSV